MLDIIILKKFFQRIYAWFLSHMHFSDEEESKDEFNLDEKIINDKSVWVTKDDILPDQCKCGFDTEMNGEQSCICSREGCTREYTARGTTLITDICLCDDCMDATYDIVKEKRDASNKTQRNS